jgi:hypothetical protein
MSSIQPNVMTNVDHFVQFVLFQNELNRRIDVVFDFLNSPFDMFNFFIYLVIKSLTILGDNCESIVVDNIDMNHISLIKDRFKYAGIHINIDIITEENNNNMIYIHQNGDGKNVEHFSLNIMSKAMRYKLFFTLKTT